MNDESVMNDEVELKEFEIDFLTYIIMSTESKSFEEANKQARKEIKENESF